MAQILKLAQLNVNGLENLRLDINEVVGDSFTFGGSSGTNVTKTTIDLLIAQTHAPMSDNQNVVAGAGLTGGGSTATVTLNIVAGDNSLTVNADDVIVKRDSAGAVGLTASGLLVNTDAATIEIFSNSLRIKDLGVSTAKLNTKAVTDDKLSSDASVDANRAVGTDHIKNASVTSDKLSSAVAGDGIAGGGGSALSVDMNMTIFEFVAGMLDIQDLGIPNIKLAAGIPATKIGSGTVNDTEFAFLDGVSSSIQTQLDNKVPATRVINTSSPLTGGGALSSDLTLSMPAANGSTNGYLSSTDWSTFNNKQPTLTYIDASVRYASGLAANTPLTLPGSASFNSSTAADINIIVNDLWKEVTRDFTVVGSAPYTQIQFIYDLPNDAVVRVKQVK